MSVSEFPYPGNARSRPVRLAASVRDVALWWCELDDELATVPSLAAWLSSQERARAARYGSESLAHRYIRGRAALRWILGRRLGIPPAQVPIERGERGRPRLTGRAEVDFNVSNTRSIALVGVVDSPATRIGVDVEHEDRALDHVGLARKYLTSREQAAIPSGDADGHRRSFLRLWTCKEAMSKATGHALSAPLRKLDVEIAPSLRLADGPPPYVADDWQLAAIHAPAGFIATVALWRAAATPASRAVLDSATPNR